jgi:uncharacterized protein (TIGR00730 family)
MQICVFCGANAGLRTIYREQAQRLGEALAQRGIGLVYGGGRVGLMGALADSALAAGAQVIGVIPHMLSDKEIAHGGLTQMHLVSTMHERKALMADLADAFIALPGGYGTLDELCEILTWAQLGLHQKPCALYNIEGYYDSLLTLLDHATQEGFLRPEHRALVLVEHDLSRLLDRLLHWRPPAQEPIRQWIEREDI